MVLVENLNRIGYNIARLRNTLGITTTELASKAGTSQSLISGIENNGKKPSIETFVKIAVALEATPNDLLGIENSVKDIPFISKNLARLRGKRTYEEYAEYLKNKGKELGFDAPAWLLKQIENGKQKPIKEFVQHIADVEGVDINFFYNEDSLEDNLYFMDENVKKWVKDPLNYKTILLAYNDKVSKK